MNNKTAKDWSVVSENMKTRNNIEKNNQNLLMQ